MQNPAAPREACVPEPHPLPAQRLVPTRSGGDLLPGGGCGAASPPETVPEPSSSGQTFQGRDISSWREGLGRPPWLGPSWMAGIWSLALCAWRCWNFSDDQLASSSRRSQGLNPPQSLHGVYQQNPTGKSAVLKKYTAHNLMGCFSWLC